MSLESHYLSRPAFTLFWNILYTNP